MNKSRLLQIIREEVKVAELADVSSKAASGVSFYAGKAATAFAESVYDAVGKSGREINDTVSLIVQSAAKRVRDACVNAALEEYNSAVRLARTASKKKA